MAATLHKLTAGDGYLYLIRQVAASDSTERGRNTLSEYYSAKGESPGRWVGTGLASLSNTGARDVSEHARAGNLDCARGFRGPRRADGRTVRGRVAPQRRRHHQLHPGPRSPTGRGHRSRPPGPPIRRAHRRNRVSTGTGSGLPRAQRPARPEVEYPHRRRRPGTDPNHPGAAAIRRPIRSRARRRPRTVGLHRPQHPRPHHGGRRVRRDVQPRQIRVRAVGGRPAGGGPRHRGVPRRRRRRCVGLHGSPRAPSPDPVQPGWLKSTPPA